MTEVPLPLRNPLAGALAHLRPAGGPLPSARSRGVSEGQRRRLAAWALSRRFWTTSRGQAAEGPQRGYHLLFHRTRGSTDLTVLGPHMTSPPPPGEERSKVH